MDEFKKGMIVQLKSGGPRMTVAEVKSEYIACEWFFEDKPLRHSFNPQSLKVITEE
jgi:uncharacterized protein YodC (DUF2158 family)